LLNPKILANFRIGNFIASLTNSKVWFAFLKFDRDLGLDAPENTDPTVA